MTVHIDSRFKIARVGFAVDTDEERSTIFGTHKTTRVEPRRSRRYSVKGKDTFESIAFEEFGNGNKWYALADVNPGVFFPLDLEAADEIVIPPRMFVDLS